MVITAVTMTVMTIAAVITIEMIRAVTTGKTIEMTTAAEITREGVTTIMKIATKITGIAREIDQMSAKSVIRIRRQHNRL